MGKKQKEKPFEFEKEYKGLPVKKRVGLIKIARNLLKQQKDNNATLADADSVPPTSSKK